MINPETINQIKELILPIAEKIGQGGEFGWEVVVKQQIIYGSIFVFIGLIGIIGLSIILKNRKWFLEYSKSPFESDRPFYLVALLVLVLAMLIIGIEGIARLCNPEFYAIQFFLDLVK